MPVDGARPSRGQGGQAGQGGQRGQRGQATVELVLVLPVVMLALLAVVQVGLLGRDRLLLAHAGREAARSVAVDPRPIVARAAAEASGPALDPDRLELRLMGPGQPLPGDRLRVVLTYRAPTEVPLVGRLLPDVAMASEVTIRVE